MTTRKRHNRRTHYNKDVRYYITKLYKGIDGYGGDDSYNKKLYDTTYGEITLKGIETLVTIYSKYQPITSYPSKQRVFYDLGSGIGKNVFMVAALVPEIQSIGIEIVKDRHDTAVDIYNKYKYSSKTRITFINRSLYDYSVQDAAWIFISNLCFTHKMNEDLVKKLEKEIQPNTLIACSVELPHINKIKLIRTYSIPMTWDKSSTIYLYKMM
jgi:hypothetical protein